LGLLEALTCQPMNPRSDGNEDFAMVFTEELSCTVVEATAAKRLQPRDSLALLGLLAHMNWRSGRIRVTLKALAAELYGKSTPASYGNLLQSIARLKREGLLVRVREQTSGDTYYLLNPRLASVGGPQRRGHLFQQFQEALGQAEQDG
jgi:hypothetical protein